MFQKKTCGVVLGQDMLPKILGCVLCPEQKRENIKPAGVVLGHEMLPTIRGRVFFRTNNCGVVLGHDMLPKIRAGVLSEKKTTCGVVLGHDMLGNHKIHYKRKNTNLKSRNPKSGF